MSKSSNDPDYAQISKISDMFNYNQIQLYIGIKYSFINITVIIPCISLYIHLVYI